MLRVDFLRHGALKGGVKYRGCLDEAITPEGRMQMDMVWAEVCSQVTKIISSPLSRCAIPAQDWANEKGVHCILDNRIKELSYGDWEGLTAAEIEHQYPNQLQAWRDDPTHLTPPNGESMQHFADRVLSFWHTLIQDHDDEHVLVVAHSGSIRLLLAYALGAPVKTTRHLAMPYACWSRVEVQGGQVWLQFHARQAG